MLIHIKKLHPDAKIPEFKTLGSAGFDLIAIQDQVILPGETANIGTGLAFEIPEGWQLEVRPRSGLSFNTVLRISNSPGTIDSDYRGELQILAWNPTQDCPQYGGGTTINIVKGESVAQGVLTRVQQATFQFVSELSETGRGTGGFGSTGK
jgi:dUTP pyrophosphatase